MVGGRFTENRSGDRCILLQPNFLAQGIVKLLLLRQFRLSLQELIVNFSNLLRQLFPLNFRLDEIVLLPKLLQLFLQTIHPLSQLRELVFNKLNPLTDIALAVF